MYLKRKILVIEIQTGGNTQAYSSPRRPLGHSGFYNQMNSSLTQSLETKLSKAFSSNKSLVHKGVGWRHVGHLERERNGRQTLYVSHPRFTKEHIIKVSAVGVRRKWNHVTGAERGSYSWHLIWCFSAQAHKHKHSQPRCTHATMLHERHTHT